MKKTKKIEFTKNQFKDLLEMVYLGNWMANANRINDIIKKYEKLEHYIFSFAKDFGFKKYVDDEDADKGLFFPTRAFEEKTDVSRLHEEYDDATFWDEIIDRLAHRDFVKKYGISRIRKMDMKERWEKLSEFEKKYVDEINKNGIERLEVRK